KGPDVDRKPPFSIDLLSILLQAILPRRTTAIPAKGAAEGVRLKVTAARGNLPDTEVGSGQQMPGMLHADRLKQLPKGDPLLAGKEMTEIGGVATHFPGHLLQAQIRPVKFPLDILDSPFHRVYILVKRLLLRSLHQRMDKQ